MLDWIFVLSASVVTALSRRGSEVSGVAVITNPDNGVLKVTYDCAGLEPSVQRGGIHVHQGNSCNNIGEYYSGNSGSSPFTTFEVAYHSDARGVAQGSFLVNGLTLSPLTGHVFVMHLVLYNDAVPTSGLCSRQHLIDSMNVSSAQACKDSCGISQRSRGCGAAYYNPRLELCMLYRTGGCDFPTESGIADGQIVTTRNTSYSCAHLLPDDSQLIAKFVAKRATVSSMVQVQFTNVLDDITARVVRASLCEFIGDALFADPVSCLMTRLDRKYEFTYVGVVLNDTLPSVSNWSSLITAQLADLSAFANGTWEDPGRKNISAVFVEYTLIGTPYVIAAPPEPSKEKNTGMIIGIVVGVLVALCLLIGCLACFCICRRRHLLQAKQEIVNGSIVSGSSSSSSAADAVAASTPLVSSYKNDSLVSGTPGQVSAVLLHTPDPVSYAINERSPLKFDQPPLEERKFSLPTTFYDSPQMKRGNLGAVSPALEGKRPEEKSSSLNENRLFKTSHNSYQASRILGQGKFGVAYLVTDEQRHTYVLKTLHCLNDIDRNEALKEAKALGQAPDSVHLLKQKDYWFDGEDFCMLLNYCSGGSLEQQVGQRLDIPEIERILRELCQGLSILHGAHLVHRDLKPDNVFFSDPLNRTVVIGDMGLARFVEETEFYESKFGHLLYKAPEITEGKYSRSSDMWSVGCIGFELLSGKTLASYYQDTHLVLGLCEERKRDRVLTDVIGAHSQTAVYSIIRGLLSTSPEHRLTAEGVVNFTVAPRTVVSFGDYS